MRYEGYRQQDRAHGQMGYWWILYDQLSNDSNSHHHHRPTRLWPNAMAHVSKSSLWVDPDWLAWLDWAEKGAKEYFRTRHGIASPRNRVPQWHSIGSIPGADDGALAVKRVEQNARTPPSKEVIARYSKMLPPPKPTAWRIKSMRIERHCATAREAIGRLGLCDVHTLDTRAFASVYKITYRQARALRRQRLQELL